MRFLELYLKAVGPFTERRLDLSPGEHGLHLVFGPNEAGKSSALRALKALLYGFPQQTSDNFLHPYEQLRVGGRLRHSDGTETGFLRRKGSRGTILSLDDESPLDGAFLDRCLQGVEEKVFSSLFGIDHDALVQGGRELLEGRGDVGQALFAAGLGTRNLRRVLQSLGDEADGLFLPRGQKPRINAAIAAFREARRELGELSLSGREWEGSRAELERRREESAELERRLVALKTERHRLGRLKRTLPRLAQRRDLLLRLEALGDVVVLPDDFAERRREVREAARAALEARRRAEAELAELSAQTAGLDVPRSLLDQAETIERLHQGVAKYVSQVAERSRLLVRREDLRAGAEQLLDDIRPGLTPEEAEGLRPGLEHWMEIQELIQERSILAGESEQAQGEAREAALDLEALRQELEALPAPRDPARLRRRVEEARRAGDLDRVLAESAAAVRKEEEQLRIELDRLGLWNGAFEELERLPVPAAETLERFRGGLDAAAERRRRVEEQRREARAGLAESERRLEEIRLGGAVPSEDDLAAARERRDRLWDEVRAGSLAGISAYERSVREADEIADRLRREAGRVQEQARLLADRERLRRLVAELDAEAEESAAAERRLGESWRDLWRGGGIEPLPPRDMQAWAVRQERLRARAEALRVVRRDAAALGERREELRAAVLRELRALRERSAAGEELEPVLARGEELVRLLEHEARRHAQLAAAVRGAEARLARARDAEAAALADLEDWTDRWGEAIAGLGLGRDALPAYVLRFQEDLKKAFQALGEAERLERQIAGLDRELEVFRAEVRSLASRTAPALVDRPVEQTAVELHARLTEARRTSDRSDALAARIGRLEREILEAEATRRSMEGRMELLRQEAGCGAEGDLDAELDEAERRSAERQRLARDLHAVEQTLLEEGEGALLEELAREAEGVDGDALPGRIEQLAREIEELETRSGDLREQLGREQRELEHRTGGDAAARAAERGQEILAGLREDVERYARLRLAAWVLRREIDRYREENQGPLLRRAGELFARLTRGSFQGLQTAFDDRDDPVLVGLRGDNRRARVEGMSSGTRDQLYLSLRLATLEKYLVHSEPLPFIVDDILIHFDDERSAATLEVLAGLARKTQVILFTHHARVRDLAAGLGNGAEVFVRELA